MTTKPTNDLLLTPCWYVKDFADGWIKFYDVDMAIHEAKETGAIMRYSSDGLYPDAQQGKQESAGDRAEALKWLDDIKTRYQDCTVKEHYKTIKAALDETLGRVAVVRIISHEDGWKGTWYKTGEEYAVQENLNPVIANKWLAIGRSGGIDEKDAEEITWFSAPTKTAPVVSDVADLEAIKTALEELQKMFKKLSEDYKRHEQDGPPTWSYVEQHRRNAQFWLSKPLTLISGLIEKAKA